jgi:hypothetical protein
MSIVLAAAQVQGGKLVSQSGNITAWQNNTLSFRNPDGLKFVPVVSPCATTLPYITSLPWIKEIGPDYIEVRDTALDTGGRVFDASNFTVVVVSLP